MTWRQHRTAYLATAATFCGLAALLVVNGLAMRADYAASGLTSCGALDSAGCEVPLAVFQQHFGGWALYIPRFGMFVPGLLAAFVAAPLIARELESGTYRFAWTQARSRTSWLTAKTALVIVPITLAALAFSALVGWWFDPFQPLMGRMSSGQAYELSGTVFAARVAFGLALGLFLGAVVHRVVAAMALTLAAWVASTWLDIVHLRPAIRAPLDLPAGSSLITRSGWTISEYFRAPDGVHIANKGTALSALYNRATHDGVHDSGTFLAWLSRHGYVHHAIYQPESRFWNFQLVETAGYFAVMLALLAALFWWIRHRVG
jgi:hypothetical protein